ncbi:MAG TPA: hypothetical protein VE010_05140 [Thermoanaerobaculia bacterium]|nr:hypothetical protein [Thermoanaerobaculia bacterium]
MASNNHRIALTFAAALALAPVVAEATISQAMKFDDKVENAAAIVVGKVVSQESRWDAEHKRILTYSTLQVEKTLKGAGATQTTIVTPGGVVGDIAQEYVGIPRFQVGEEHVVFVKNTRAGQTVLYFDQGAYRVAENDRGDRIVHPLVTNAVLVDSQRGVAVSPESPRPLREFEQQVRETGKRREAYRMEMIEKQRQQASFWNQIQENKVLVILALLGAMLATWQFFRRS